MIDTPTKPSSLGRVRVVELNGGRAGAFCAKLLAGLGATVVKVEPTGQGDPLRSLGPFVKDKAGIEASLPFLWANTGKQSVTLNTDTARGAALLAQLIQDADVLVDGTAPGAKRGAEWNVDALRKAKPRLIVCSISGFGQTGPYRDYLAEEISLYAMSGAMFITGEKSAPPLGPGPDIAQNTTGATAALAVLVALYQRGVTGEGDQIDISAHESSIDLIETAVSGFLTKGGVAQRGTHAFAPWGLFSCRDGYVTVISAPFRKWRAGSAMFEEPRLLDEKYRLVRDRVKYREEVQELIQPWLNGHTREETCERAYAKGLAFAPLATIEEGARSPQHKAREFFTEIDHPAAGRHKYSAAPFRMSATPYVTHRAPTLGEHNQAVYCDKLGLSAAALGELKTAGVI